VGFCDGKKVALEQVFSENFGFPCQFTIHLLHNHLYYHPRPGVAAVPIASQFRIKKKKLQGESVVVTFITVVLTYISMDIYISI
jgi:hypothetical protein